MGGPASAGQKPHEKKFEGKQQQQQQGNNPKKFVDHRQKPSKGPQNVGQGPKKKLSLADDDDEEDQDGGHDTGEIRINAKYAKEYEQRKKNQELSQCKGLFPRPTLFSSESSDFPGKFESHL